MTDTPLPVCLAGALEPRDATPEWLVEPLWGRAAVGFLAGAPKLGKTWLGLDLALSVATATACLDTFPVPAPGPVLLFLAEDHPSTVRERLEGLCRHRRLDLARLPLHVITAPALRLDLERDRERLADTVRRIAPTLLLLDPLVRLHRRDENHAGDVAELLGYLRELQRAYQLAVLVVHHMRKSPAANAGQALRGSGDLHAWTDSALYLRVHQQRLLLQAEHRAAPAPEPVELRLSANPGARDTHLAIVHPTTPCQHRPPPHPPSLTERLLERLHAEPRPHTRVELRRLLRVNNQRLGTTLAELEQAHLVVRTAGGWTLPSAPHQPDPASPVQQPLFRSANP